MAEPVVRARDVHIGKNVVFGQDVVIEADALQIGDGAIVGVSGRDDFRSPPGVRISGGRVTIGPNTRIGNAVLVEGGDVELHEGVKIGRNCTIEVRDRLRIGAFGTIGESCELAGRDIEFGQELWMLPFAKIGGGSAMEPPSAFRSGHYLHIGTHCLINTARPVTIGHEVGLGTRTSIYTHGAYPSALMGFPVAFAGVEIGDFTWIPGATINPGVRIGRNCVVAVNSLVNADLPDGCLAGGSPAKVLREAAYPRPLDPESTTEFYRVFFERYRVLLGDPSARAFQENGLPGLAVQGRIYLATRSIGPASNGARVLLIADAWDPTTPLEDTWTVFDIEARRIRGLADDASIKLANELRRYGIRFYSRPHTGSYVDWTDEVPQFIPGRGD